MSDLLVRDVDPAAVARLKARALQHGRSLQAEVKSILEAEAALSDATAWLNWVEDFRARLAPPAAGASSLDLLRESRDER